MNNFWKCGYPGITVMLCVGKRKCWKWYFNRRAWQFSFGWVQLRICFYDVSALTVDMMRAENAVGKKNDQKM